ncbi:phosphate acyltransferase [Marivita geojedonensis]|uniref:Phosphate acetyltransferase n=1 Tax=Marivita geojedonensis TaxID=1123756 RepID=A0A1X4NR38_9RHOB|nr:phosphate acyltransferase [Marivita geojedonensis]OSQ53423.1 phosphate acetyltransferase [Marivita geojedonensis]PRY81592.1 phosphate acetyltransferase [Marivita geojedonensis]
MSVLDKARAAAAGSQTRVVFPERDDPRVADAAQRLTADGLCIALDVSEDITEAQVAALVSARGMKEALACRLLQKPLYRAAAMVAAGEADAMVAGADSPTRRVIEAASMAIGLAEGVAIPSSYFLMVFPDGRELVFADCAVNVDPDAAALEAIARASADTAKALLGDARVALLSFSTGTSGAGDSVERVRAVAEATGFAGPVQADAALNATIAAKKGLGSGDANVLVFPSLDAGNIAYKLCQELGGAQAIGPFLQGFARPVCDLSRGATVDDIVASTLVTIALAQRA